MTVAADENVLTPKTLNNFVVSMRESIRQARVHLIHHHSRRIKTLTKASERQVNDDDSDDKQTLSDSNVEEQASPTKRTSTVESKNKKKALKLSQEIKAVKCFSDGDLGKLVLLNSKTFNEAAREECSGGQRAVCRIAENAAVVLCKQNFGTKFGDTVKDLPFCIKVVGNQHQYKKVRKLGLQGKKEKFLQTQRFYFKLLQEIGGAEFATAEDLYNKLKVKKQKQKESRRDKRAKTGVTNKEGSESKGEGEEALSDDEETAEQVELRNKIFQKLDDKFGKWEDESSEDSEMDEPDEADLSSSENLHRETTDKIKPSKQIKCNITSNKVAKSARDVNKSGPNDGSEKQSKVPLVSNPKVLTKNINGAQKLQLSPKKLVSNKIKDVNKSGNIIDKQLKVPLNSPTKSDVNDRKSAPVIPKFNAFEVQQIDLTKAKHFHKSIPLVCKKRTIESDLDDDDELPRRTDHKKIKLQPKKTDQSSQRSGLSFFHGKEESSDEEESDHDTSAEWVLGNDEAQGEWSKGEGNRGRARGGSRGGVRGGGAWGNSNSETSRGRGRGRGRGVSGQGDGAGFGSRRGAGGNARAITNRGGGRGDASTRGQRPEMSNRRGQVGDASSEGLHPSWEAKKRQTIGIAGFQGKKTTFD